MATTMNDFNSFRAESFDDKVMVLYYYLCESGNNMQDIAHNVLGDNGDHAPRRVSVITRCYGFNGANGGVFRNLDVDMEDVAAFVRMYPNGCPQDENGETMRAFLQKRVQTRDGGSAVSLHNGSGYQYSKPDYGYSGAGYGYSGSRSGIGDVLRNLLTSKKFWIGVVLIVGIIVLVKACGKGEENVSSVTSSVVSESSASSESHVSSANSGIGEFMSSVGDAIGAFFGKVWDGIKFVIAAAIALALVVIPIINFFKNRVWKDLGQILWGGFLFICAFAMFKNGSGIAALIVGLVLWLIGLHCWQDK